MDVGIWVRFQFRCKCLYYLLGLVPVIGGENFNKGAKVTGMTNHKYK